MGYMTDGLTFNTLRGGNMARRERGAFTTSADWSLNDWMTALNGEVGEAANICKKIRRGDFTLDEARDALARELADAVTYLDHVAAYAGIDLGEAVISKFNEVSKEVGSRVRLAADDWHLDPDAPLP